MLGGREVPRAQQPNISTTTAFPGQKLGWFEKVNSRANSNPSLMNRDYTIIVDRSGSMSSKSTITVPQKIADMDSSFTSGTQSMSWWKQAEAALLFLSAAAVREDPDGISLIFFDSGVTIYENVRSASAVMNAFRWNSPSGSTNLAGVLREALTPDMLGRAETVLVITDGVPDSEHAAETEIVKAARQLCREDDLAISFIQVGDSSSASAYLKRLDDDLEDRYKIFDIVDTMDITSMGHKSFLEVVALGITD